jgi:hypothetical protein
MIHSSLANKIASGCQIPLPRTATWHALWSFGIKILQGEKPADIPVEQPGKFELAINLRTAKALDLRIAEAFLIRADRASTDAADFRCWPEASVSCLTAIRPESRVKPTCQDAQPTRLTRSGHGHRDRHLGR